MYLSNGVGSLHYLSSSKNTVVFNIGRPHQTTDICGLIFVVGV
jgi:hypothetical protein